MKGLGKRIMCARSALFVYSAIMPVSMPSILDIKCGFIAEYTRQ